MLVLNVLNNESLIWYNCCATAISGSGMDVFITDTSWEIEYGKHKEIIWKHV